MAGPHELSHHAVCRIEFLTHDINVHVPHHVSTRIPWYNLRQATDSLRENWGEASPASLLLLLLSCCSLGAVLP